MKVFIVGADALISKMWRSAGHQHVFDVRESDIIQFVGGEDVSPFLYGEKPHPQTGFDTDRDMREMLVYEYGVQNRIPMAGICRGGQFLNVMNRGRMYQHVDGHAVGSMHIAMDTRTKQEILVTSTHHQMMVPGDRADVFLTARMSSFRQFVHNGTVKQIQTKDYEFDDIEGIHYESTNCVCFQPHPEYDKQWPEGPEIYFEYLKEFLGVGS